MRTQHWLSSITLASALTAGLVAPAAAQLAAPASEAAVSASASPSASDPNLDRAFLQPTAMTQPAGTVTYNNYELLLHGVTYGVTKDVQVSVTVLSPIVKDMPFFGVIAVKGHILGTDRLHLSLQGSAGYLHVFTNSNPNSYTVGAGALASFCLRDDCSSLLSGSATYQLAVAGGSSSQPSHVIIYGGSLVHSVTSHVKLLAEVTSAAGKSGSSSFDNVSGFLASYGVRFHNDSLAGDIGFIKPIGQDTGDLLLGIPFVSVSYRWN